MTDSIINGAHFTVFPGYISVFGAEARMTVSGDWEHNFDGWFHRGHSRVFRPFDNYNLDTFLKDCIVSADNMGRAGDVAMIIVSPPMAAGLYVEKVLTQDSFESVVSKKFCFFDIPAVCFGEVKTPMRLRVAQNPGYKFCCGAADITGMLL